MKCPRCKNGKINVTVTTFGTGEVNQSVLDCPTCKGTGKVTPEQMKDIEYENHMWCECEEPELGVYPDDGECTIEGCRVYKHHVHCAKCDKITQIG